MAPGPTQILIVALIILLLFGATRLSEIGKGLGEGIRNFKKGLQDDDGKVAGAEDEAGAGKHLPPRAKAPVEDAVEESDQQKA